MTLDTPRHEELRKLPIVEKGDARGLPWVVFVFLRLGRFLGSSWAREVYEDFKQEILGATYWFGAVRTGGEDEGKLGQPPSLSLQGHESVHDWQRRTYGTLRHWTWYYNPFDRSMCLELEAQACGYEVAIHGRLAEERGRMLFNGPYWLRTELGEITGRIEHHAELFRQSWEPLTD